MFQNIPKIKAGIVAVSRDCFPESLSVNRRRALVEAYRAKYDEADISVIKERFPIIKRPPICSVFSFFSTFFPAASASAI